MRDPARIDEILNQLSRIWKAHPDFRFNQLLYILQSEFSEANKGYGKVESEEVDGFKKVGFDLFNVEDESFQKYLTKTLDSGSWGKGV